MSKADRQLQEPRALVAVERSAQVFARVFPYLIWRHGPAGLQALRDDNAQLIATAGNKPAEFGSQVEWAVTQMNQRGMPSWMLEVNLELMARTTRRLLPEDPDRSARLEHAARELATGRRAVMSEPKFRRSAASFADALGLGPSRLWFGFGQILTSAVIDERRGSTHAVTRVREWAADARRFGPRWIGAVEASIDTTRRA